jgi:hypothetical protein
VDELTGTMTPGNYEEGVFPPEGVHTLEGGVYCLSDDFIVRENYVLEGDGVVIVMEHGKMKISGHAEINLRAPRNGPNAGLLIYMPIDNQGLIDLNGSDTSSFRGTIFAPRGEVRLNGLDSLLGAAYHSKIIAYYIEVDGADNIEVNYKPEDNWETLSMPEVILIK